MYRKDVQPDKLNSLVVCLMKEEKSLTHEPM